MKKNARPKTKVFLDCNGHNLFRQLRKLEKIKPFGLSKASKFSPSWGKWLICTKAVGWGSDLCASEPILEPAVSDISQVNVSHPYVLYTRARVYFSARITLGPDMVRNNNITLPRWPWTARRCDLLILVAKDFPTWNGYLIPSLEYCTNSDKEKCFWMMLMGDII